jgi:hypothetical protein
VATVSLVVVVALLALLGETGEREKAEDGKGFELHCFGDWSLIGKEVCSEYVLRCDAERREHNKLLLYCFSLPR